MNNVKNTIIISRDNPLVGKEYSRIALRSIVKIMLTGK